MINQINAPQERINFSSTAIKTAFPDFLDIQLKSFMDFFQIETKPSERSEEETTVYLRKIFRFPIQEIILFLNF